MKKVNNWLNYDHENHIGEINTLPSLTVPDQSMSVQEILDRYARGLPIGGSRVPIFDEEDDMPDTTHMDLADIQMLKETYADELQIIEKKRSKRSQKPADDTPKADPTEDASTNNP